MKPNKIFIFSVALQIIFATCQAQLIVSKKSITIHADTMEVRQAFKLLHYMIPKGQKINKIVVKDGHTYVQTRWMINRMLKRYAYVDGGKLRRI